MVKLFVPVWESKSKAKRHRQASEFFLANNFPDVGRVLIGYIHDENEILAAIRFDDLDQVLLFSSDEIDDLLRVVGEGEPLRGTLEKASSMFQRGLS